MKTFLIIILAIFFSCFLSLQDLLSAGSSETPHGEGVLTGAFLADRPDSYDIARFKSDYGKRPYFIMVFIDWGSFVESDIIRDVYKAGSALFITWEPWKFGDKRGIDLDKLLSGYYDGYIKEFALNIKAVNGDVFIRFAHEANGDWYPWSAAKIGSEKYVASYRHVKDVFDEEGVDNARWVFSINWEDMPKSNDWRLIYPGDAYADYIGIDGYNWGSSQSWSSWMSFYDIFNKRYNEIRGFRDKKILISEFSSSSSGGDKRAWIREALDLVKSFRGCYGFVLFNQDKETDWSFPASSVYGKELRSLLADDYFKEVPSGERREAVFNDK